MQRLVLIAAFLLLTSFVLASTLKQNKDEEEKYVNLFEDEILNSKRVYNNYFNCFLTGKKCTTNGRILKGLLPHAIKTDCHQCTGEQKRSTDKVIAFMIKQKFKDFKKIEKLYDPEHTYRKRNADKFEAASIISPDLKKIESAEAKKQ